MAGEVFVYFDQPVFAGNGRKIAPRFLAGFHPWPVFLQEQNVGGYHSPGIRFKMRCWEAGSLRYGLTCLRLMADGGLPSSRSAL
jgi:hypothetical protein